MQYHTCQYVSIGEINSGTPPPLEERYIPPLTGLRGYSNEQRKLHGLRVKGYYQIQAQNSMRNPRAFSHCPHSPPSSRRLENLNHHAENQLGERVSISELHRGAEAEVESAHGCTDGKISVSR